MAILGLSIACASTPDGEKVSRYGSLVCKVFNLGCIVIPEPANEPQ